MTQPTKNSTRIAALVCLILAIVTVDSRAQEWEVVDFPPEEDISGISFIGHDTAFLVTFAGNLYRTYDGGEVWQGKNLAPDIPLEDIQFVDSIRGFVCGRYGRIFRSIDGGNTWQDCSLKDTVSWLLSLEMFEGKDGIITGMLPNPPNPPEGLTFLTTDGGRNWVKQKSLGSGYGELFKFDNQTLYFTSYGKLHRSGNRGKTWESTSLNLHNPARRVVIRNETGLMVGNFGLCAVSKNGGLTWTKVELQTKAHLTYAVLLDENTGFVAGHKGTLFSTTDGGQTWHRELLAKSFNIYDLEIVGNMLYAVGTDGGIIRRKIR